MSFFDFILMLVRESVIRERFPREPEPMIMNGAEQVSAYANSGKQKDGIMAASSLFHAAHATRVIYGCEQVLDFGCGPGNQLIQIAQLNPDTSFVGIELSQKMIDHARSLIQANSLRNVTIVQGDITKLENFSTASVDGIISTMTLHHLPDIGYLRLCFQQIHRILKPNGALYLADFGRLKSLDSVCFFANMHKESLPPEVIQDYKYSLQAAYSVEEYKKLIQEEDLQWVHIYKTFLIPFMVIVKSSDRSVDAKVVSHLSDLLNRLSPRFREDLKSLRFFFRLSGLDDLRGL